MEINVTEKIKSLQISWSLLETYSQCPFKFHQKYILGKVEPTNMFAFYGTAFHSLLDHLYKTENFIPKYGYNNWERYLWREYKLSYKQEQYSKITEKQVESLKFLGFKHLKNFYTLGEQNGILKKAVFNEKQIRANYKNHRIIGKIDLGIKLDKYGLVLLDWKTGKEDIKSLAQLVLYAALYSKKEGQNIEWVAPVYLDTSKIKFTKITPEMKEKVSKGISKIYNKLISDSTFVSSPNEYCKYCNFKNICPSK